MTRAGSAWVHQGLLNDRILPMPNGFNVRLVGSFTHLYGMMRASRCFAYLYVKGVDDEWLVVLKPDSAWLFASAVFLNFFLN